MRASITKQELLLLAVRDVDECMRLLDNDFIDNSTYYQLVQERIQKPGNFTMAEFSARLMSFISINVSDEDVERLGQLDIYEQLCMLNFKHQVHYFESTLRSNRIFLSFIIRGKEKDFGQSWLLNKLIATYQKSMPIHQPIIIDLAVTQFSLADLIEELSKHLEIEYRFVKDTLHKKTKIKDYIRDRIKTKTQFIILKNSYQFLHSDSYTETLNVLKYRGECTECERN